MEEGAQQKKSVSTKEIFEEARRNVESWPEWKRRAYEIWWSTPINPPVYRGSMKFQ